VGLDPVLLFSAAARRHPHAPDIRHPLRRIGPYQRGPHDYFDIASSPASAPRVAEIAGRAECRYARRATPRAVAQSRSETLTGIMGARRACTVSMISPLSMPCR
jgi:hypothetical protein